MFTMRPRADSRVSRIMFNCWRRRSRSWAFSASAWSAAWRRRSASALRKLLLRDRGFTGCIGSGFVTCGLRGGLLGLELRLFRLGTRLLGGVAVGFGAWRDVPARGAPARAERSGLLLGLRFALRSSRAFVGQLLFLDFAEGDDAGVLGHLGGFARIGLGLLAILAFVQEVLGVLEVDHAFLKVSAA